MRKKMDGGEQINAFQRKINNTLWKLHEVSVCLEVAEAKPDSFIREIV